MCLLSSVLNPKQGKRYLKFYLKSDTLYSGDNMSDILNFIGCLVALLLVGSFAIFSFILAQHKDEIWEEIYETDNERYDKNIQDK